MKIIDKLRDYVSNENYDERDEDLVDDENNENEKVEEKRTKVTKQSGRDRHNITQPSYDQQPSTSSGFVVYYPQQYREVKEIADQLIAGKTVLLNLEATPRDEARRLVDFLSGVAYSRGGEPKRVSTATFIITSSKVDVEGADMFDGSDDDAIRF